MSRQRYKTPLDPIPGRITGTELGKWLQFNGLSEGDLAEAVFAETATVRGWVRGHRHTPATLAKRINLAAQADKPIVPRWGQRFTPTTEPGELPPHAPPPDPFYPSPDDIED